MESKIDGIESECVVKLQHRLDASKDQTFFSLHRDELEYLLKRCQPIQTLDHDDLRSYVVGEVEKALADQAEAEVEFQAAATVLDGVVTRISAGVAGSGFTLEDGLYGLIRMEDIAVGVAVLHGR